MVSGSPGPAPAAQARASSSRLISWRTWPHRKLRRNVPRVEGALTMHPSTEEVRPESASASSMQSPPASAEATSVSILSPAFARPGAYPRSRCGQLTQAHALGQGGRKKQSGIVDQAVVVEGDLDAVGVLKRKPLSQMRTFLPLHHAASSLRWIGA